MRRGGGGERRGTAHSLLIACGGYIDCDLRPAVYWLGVCEIGPEEKAKPMAAVILALG